jgi:MFS family permease
MRQRTLPGAYPLTFYLAFLADVLFFSSMHLLITPLPLYVEEIGGGDADVGLATTTFALAAIATRPFMGRLVDTWGRKPILLIGAGAFTLAPLSYMLVRSVPALLAARMFHGLGIAAFTTAYFALVADVTPRVRWGAAIGAAGIAPSISLILASPLGTGLIQRTSFRTVFLVAALAALLSFVISLMIQEPHTQSTAYQTTNPTSPGLLDIVRLRGVLVPSLATVTLGLSYGAIFTFLPLFGRDRSLGNVGFFFSASGIAIMLSRAFAGRLSDKVGRTAIIIPMFLVLAISTAGLNWTYGLAMLIVMAIAFGIGFGGTRVGVDTMVVDSAPPRARGTALGLLYLCLDSGVAIGGMVMGVLAELAGYGEAYVLLAVACILTALLFGLAMRKREAT